MGLGGPISWSRWVSSVPWTCLGACGARAGERRTKAAALESVSMLAWKPGYRETGLPVSRAWIRRRQRCSIFLGLLASWRQAGPSCGFRITWLTCFEQCMGVLRVKAERRGQQSSHGRMDTREQGYMCSAMSMKSSNPEVGFSHAETHPQIPVAAGLSLYSWPWLVRGPDPRIAQ